MLASRSGRGSRMSKPSRPRPSGQRSIRPMAALVQAHGDELGQPLALPDNPERTVAGVHEPDGRLDDPLQRGLEVQAGTDGDHRFEQAVHPVAGREDGLQARLQLGEQVVQLAGAGAPLDGRWPTRPPAGRGRSQVPFG